MVKLIDLTIENVRCFKGKHTFNIRPITFIIGENSTGKSTVLSSLNALINNLNYNMMGDDTDVFKTPPNQLEPNVLKLDPNVMKKDIFNIAPYSMGVFNDIVSKSDKEQNSNSSTKNFKLSATYNINDQRVVMDHTFFEKKSGTEPVLQSIKYQFSDSGSIEIKIANIEKRRLTENKDYQFQILMPEKEFFMGNFLTMMRVGAHAQKDLPISIQKKLLAYIERHKNIAEAIEYTKMPQNLSPARSKPQRTYNPSITNNDPEGVYTPMILCNMAHNNVFEEIQVKLRSFGKNSGLFDDIHVRRLGETKNDPFQIQFIIKGVQSNFLDVGYGVSQVLPLLVKIFASKFPSIFFVQQPEMHLHPQAQASLASLLGTFTKHHYFITETHSDYMIDRMRIEIMKGNVKPDDVSLIYLEAGKNGVTQTHNITFDEQGNMDGVPDGYRKFFLHETNELLGL